MTITKENNSVKSPRVSVVIPCFNQGVYVESALESVNCQTFRDFEIIIVNDGSTDEETNQILATLNRPKTRVLCTTNQGLAAARNNGISASCGEYILPLDADDKIAPTYLDEAVTLLDAQPDLGIVYCLAETFGERTGLWRNPDYSLRGMLLGNLIFCSALYRKMDWAIAGGYRTNMKAGWEDWDFWLSIIEQGRKVYRIPKVLFYYRVKAGSMVDSMRAETKVAMHHQVIRNHKDLYVDNAIPLLSFYYRLTGSRPYRLVKSLKLSYVFSFLLGRMK